MGSKFCQNKKHNFITSVNSYRSNYSWNSNQANKYGQYFSRKLQAIASWSFVTSTITSIVLQKKQTGILSTFDNMLLQLALHVCVEIEQIINTF